MPTRMELVGIVDYSVNDPSINGVTFPGTPNVSFHTSTDGTVVMTGGVWYVGFWTGFTGVQSSTTLARVRCVRTVVPMTGTFVDQADGTRLAASRLDRDVYQERRSGLLRCARPRRRGHRDVAPSDGRRTAGPSRHDPIQSRHRSCSIPQLQRVVPLDIVGESDRFHRALGGVVHQRGNFVRVR